MKFFLTLTFTILSATANAAEVVKCAEYQIGLGDIVQPAFENTKSYYNNQVAVYNVDYLEPAACSAGLAVVIPDKDAELPGLTKCFLVKCFGKIDIAEAKSAYDPNTGLKLTLTPDYFDPGTGVASKGDPISVNVNLEAGTVTIQ